MTCGGGAGSGVMGHLDKEGPLQRLSQVIITAEQSKLLRDGPLPSQHVGFLQHLQLLPETDTEPPQTVTMVTDRVTCTVAHLWDCCQNGNAAHLTVLIKHKSNDDLKEMSRSYWFSEPQYKSNIFIYFLFLAQMTQQFKLHIITQTLCQQQLTKRMTDKYDGSLYWQINL